MPKYDDFQLDLQNDYVEPIPIPDLPVTHTCKTCLTCQINGNPCVINFWD